MTSGTIVRARIDEDLKNKSSEILSSMGLSVSDAIRLMLAQVVSQNALPFSIKAPNRTTIETFETTDNNKDVVKCKDADDMFGKLGI
jgi:DNA-damage-inducible protein J